MFGYEQWEDPSSRVTSFARQRFANANIHIAATERLQRVRVAAMLQPRRGRNFTDGAWVDLRNHPAITQNSLPSGSAITVQRTPFSSCTGPLVAPSARRRSTAASNSAPPRSRWTRFLPVFGSGTRWRSRSGSEGSRVGGPSTT